MAVIAAFKHTPFTLGFRLFAIAYLSSVNSLPWLTIRLRIGWRIAGCAGSFVGFFGVLLWCFSGHVDFVNAASVAAFSAVAHFLVLRYLIPERQMRSAVLAHTITTIYAAFVWVYLQDKGIILDSSSKYFYDAFFMFISPFLASLLWAASVLVKQGITVQIGLAVAILQPAIGFVDLEKYWGVPWAVTALWLSLLGSFGAAVYCLKLKRPSDFPQTQAGGPRF